MKVNIVDVALLAAPKLREGVRGRVKMPVWNDCAIKLEVYIGLGGRSGHCERFSWGIGFVLSILQHDKTNLKVPLRALKRLQRLLIHRLLNNSQRFAKKCRFKAIFGRQVDVSKCCIAPLKFFSCYGQFWVDVVGGAFYGL